MENTAIYTKFMDWLAGSWYGVPAPDEALPVVMERYTPEEAEFLTGIPLTPAPLGELAATKGMDAASLGARLDALTAKGLVFRYTKGDAVFYNLNDIFMQARTFGWPGRKDERSVRVAVKANRYWEHGFLDPWTRTNVKGLRVIPIGEALEDKRTVVPYDNVMKLLDGVGYFTVSTCPCRHVKNLDPAYPDSKYPMEVCLHFDRLGRYIVQNGMGREITREETEAILTRAAEAGLVHSISNQQERADTICNCDRDYCMWFTLHHKLGHHMSIVPSASMIRTNDATCKGCGLCVKRCPMGALELRESAAAANKTGKAAALAAEKCIGCGVCAYKCPTSSLRLVPRENAAEPPRTGRDFAMKLMTDFMRGGQKG